jgi:non-specific serine/threonine protein kinase/serine/threonine-protein kinase
MEAERWRTAKRIFLEAIEQDQEARAAHLQIACAGDASLVADVQALLAAHAAAGDRFETPLVAVVSEEPAPDRVGPYRVLRELGRGGMGTVYLGVREGDELEQPVAIKIIKRGMDSAVIVRRFRNERLILASLHHPNIARLYEGGTTEDGLPYFVMEFVEGSPLDDYCESEGLGMDARLRLFRQVCTAVQYAHQNLVVHRDLKPGNILVTAEGAPKLLDFGIAKLLDPMAAPGATDLTVERALTPEYASPEQIRGEAMTTVSDVYSLGVVLYRLLTGLLPYRFATRVPREILRVIHETSPQRPSTAAAKAAAPERRAELRRRLAGDLDTIVLRALHRDPARRYASAEQFADDVRRHLDGFPVRARPDTLGYRARKFIGRHRVGVAASVLAVLTLLGATATALWQARVAGQQRARAERRFTDVRRLANVLLFDVHGALDNVAGAMGARRLLVENALRYLDDLSREAANDSALLRELASGYERIGEIQGMPGWPSEGRTGDALASFERALELRRSLPDAGRAGGVADAAEARLLLRIGSVLAARGATGSALARHAEALAAFRAVVASSPTTELRLELAQALVAVGDDVWEGGDVPAAAQRYREARDVARSAVAVDPRSPLAVRQLGVIEQRLGDSAAEGGDWHGALEHHRGSLEVDRQLAARNPGDAEVRRDLGTDLSRLGVDQAKLGRLTDSLAQHEEAARLREALLADEPQDARALEDAAESRFETGKVLSRLGRTPEAVGEIKVAVERWNALSERDPSNARWRDVLAGALTTLGAVELERSGRDAAAVSLERALAIRIRLAAESPEFASNRSALAALESVLAELRAGGREPDLRAALAAWR